MGWFRSGAGAMAVLSTVSLVAPTPPAIAQATPPAAPQAAPSKSVYGKLQGVDKKLNAVIMRSDDGKRLVWQFDAAVIAELAGVKPGAPMIVIYRQMAPNEKRVTAVAFPGTASAPTYVNMTGFRVVLRSAPAKDGVCGAPDAGPVTESTVPIGGLAEIQDACWCCADSGESCTPGNKSGVGRALLVRCFQ